MKLLVLLRNALIAIGAVGGAICIVTTLLAIAGGYSLVMFKTGSMSPSIPAGSLAVVQQISAADINTGDIITVSRAGKLPVTHRVTSIHPLRGSSGEVEITMKGDANDSDDAEPYVVSQARIVIWSAPSLAYIVVWLTKPWVLGSITAAAAGLVAWAFWPRRSSRVGLNGARPSGNGWTRRP